MLSLLKDSNQRLLQMVNNLLDTVRYGEGSLPAHFKPIRIVRLSHSCLQEMSLLAKSKGVVVICARANADFQVQADDQAIRSLVANLLRNAIKVAGEDGTVVVSLQANTDSMEIRICDSGPGISQSDRQNLFQCFWQAHPTRSGSFGTGLGLYLCNQIAEHHGGTIRYERDQSSTRFSVTLPLSVELPAEVLRMACAPAEAV